MAYQGDYALASVINFKFTTVDATGLPTTLSSTPALSIYKSNNTTQTTTGVTLTVDFDSVTGLNNVNIDTADAFYTTATDFDIIITTGTVDSVSVVGYSVGSFSLNNRSALRPTTAARTLDVASTGEAGLDFDNIKAASSPTTLTNITIPAVTTVSSVSGAVGSVAGNVSGNVSGNVVGTVASIVGNVAGNVVGSVGSVVGAVGSVTAGVSVTTNNDKTGYSLAAGQFQIKKNTSFSNFSFPMFSSTTHQLITGKTVTSVLCIDGGALVSTTNAASEVGGGLYKINFAAADLNGNSISLKLTSTGCDDIIYTFVTQV